MFSCFPGSREGFEKAISDLGLDLMALWIDEEGDESLGRFLMFLSLDVV